VPYDSKFVIYSEALNSGFDNLPFGVPTRLRCLKDGQVYRSGFVVGYDEIEKFETRIFAHPKVDNSVCLERTHFMGPCAFYLTPFRSPRHESLSVLGGGHPQPARDVENHVESKSDIERPRWFPCLFRDEVRKRDNLECQECKRQGKVFTIKSELNKRKRLDVDHIKELEDYPELCLAIENLETLCIRCHNKKHNRYQKKESKWNDECW